jgi:hypothetical protein
MWGRFLIIEKHGTKISYFAPMGAMDSPDSMQKKRGRAYARPDKSSPCPRLTAAGFP